ncbi:nuclear transport factor 2 family protein [Abyssalbus ytuae]|uniref:Nuclear transport factor 2 family protein n=1 Tax=Abyssalbus ytuae TaxID=2926907 RepID=A0A9E6ZMN7_9FLAO|nr:nuclear transport factor 2 family protein [Abyssalbus ytuae]UOB18674.1 nuclear transport factor 2 family protein [Abyssalbus ytuae]
MKKIIQLMFIFIAVAGCNREQKSTYEIAGEQSRIIKEMIDAVNKKDAEKYVEGFAENVQVFVDSRMKVNGRDQLIKNRSGHFKNHPGVRSEIQHLVEIDNKVILHDKVWFDKSDKAGHNIVEIFTFENGKVVRVDVIQPDNLFEK